jgi:hypothetical protein
MLIGLVPLFMGVALLIIYFDAQRRGDNVKIGEISLAFEDFKFLLIEHLPFLVYNIRRYRGRAITTSILSV